MVEAEYQIKPEKTAPAVDTSTWPLLLKVRSLHCLFLVLGGCPNEAVGRNFYEQGEGHLWLSDYAFNAQNINTMKCKLIHKQKNNLKFCLGFVPTVRDT